MKRIAYGAIIVAAAAAIAVPTTARPTAATTTQVCTVNTTPCPSGNLYGTDISSRDTVSGTILPGHDAVLSTSLGNIDCTNSSYTAGGHSDGTAGTESGLVFNNGSSTKPCTTTLLGNPTATITVNNEPYSCSVVFVGGSNDSTSTCSNINVTIRLSNGITCTATAASVTADGYNKGNANTPFVGSGGTHSVMAIVNASVSISGPFGCPSSGTETVYYYTTTNNPSGGDVYVVS